MPINPAQASLAQPLSYADASQRVQTGKRPEPLGRDFARGLEQPAIRVEISDRAREALEAQKNRLEALSRSNTESKARGTREEPPETTGLAKKRAHSEDSPTASQTTSRDQAVSARQFFDINAQLRLDKAPSVLPSGVLSADALNAYKAVENAG